jgi:hypothetical protein
MSAPTHARRLELVSLAVIRQQHMVAAAAAAAASARKLPIFSHWTRRAPLLKSLCIYLSSVC